MWADLQDQISEQYCERSSMRAIVHAKRAADAQVAAKAHRSLEDLRPPRVRSLLTSFLLISSVSVARHRPRR